MAIDAELAQVFGSASHLASLEICLRGEDRGALLAAAHAAGYLSALRHVVGDERTRIMLDHLIPAFITSGTKPRLAFARDSEQPSAA